MKYINKIIISADEVYHYEWLNSTDICFTLVNNDIINSKLFKKIIYFIISNKISKKLISKTEYNEHSSGFSIRCKGFADNSKITMLLEEVCDYYINNKITFSKNSKKAEEFYLENYLAFKEFLEEIKEYIKNKKITYYYQSVDGFN